MRELPVEFETETEQLATNSRRTVVMSIRDRRERTGMTLRMTSGGFERLRTELGRLDLPSGDDRRVFMLTADLEVSA